jgi:hypothetical protein
LTAPISTPAGATFAIVTLWLDGVEVLHFAEHALARCDVAQQVVFGIDTSGGCFDAGVTCEAFHATTLLVGHHGDDHSGFSGTGSASRSVQEGLWFCRRIGVDHKGDVVHVNAAGGDVGGNESVGNTRGECSKITCALCL